MSAQRLVCFVVFTSVIGHSTLVKLPLFLRTDDRVAHHLDPCANFYAYSCNSWLSHTKKPEFEPIWSPWIATNHRIKHRLSAILAHHNPALVKPQIFYRWCLRIVEQESRYLQELVSLVHSLGGWPIVDHAWRETGYDWFKQLMMITSLLGIHPIVKVFTDLDYGDPRKVAIYVEAGNLIFPQHILSEFGYTTELEAYERWILDTARHMYGNSGYLKVHDVKDIIKFEMHLARAIGQSRLEKTTVGKLSKKLPVDWLGALNHMFSGFMQITPDTSLVIRNYAALKTIFLLVDRTPKKIVANYLIWAVIKDLSRETTTHMRDLNFLIDQAILGVKDDLTREYECLDSVIKYFSPLLVPPYLKTYSNPRVFRQVETMFESIKLEFVDNLNKSAWLSHEAKLSGAEKINNIKLNLGYPSSVFNATFLAKYRKLQMTGNHFTNVLKLKKFRMDQEQYLIRNSILWPSSPFEVNAYYSVLQNSICELLSKASKSK